MDDKITESLGNLSGDLPSGRPNLSEADKDALIKQVGGPKTARAISKAAKDFPQARILFIFNALDSQVVADILVNDCRAAIDRAL